MLITQSLSYDYDKGSMEKHRNAIVEELKKSLIPSVVRVLPGLIEYQSQAMDGHIQVCASVSVLPGHAVDRLYGRSSNLDKLLKHLRTEYDNAVACLEQLLDMPADEKQRQESLKTHFADLALLAGVDFRREDQERDRAKLHKKIKEAAEEDDTDPDDGLFDEFGNVDPLASEDAECEDEPADWDEPTPTKKSKPLTHNDVLAEFMEDEDEDED